MGGIAGLVNVDVAPEEQDFDVPGAGPTFCRDGALLLSRPRSTLAQNERWVVSVAGHFDRAPISGQSAAEVLLDYWSRQGIEALSHFEGAWVATVYDRQRRQLHLLRGPFGIRRLYFASRGGKLAYASRLEWLLRLPWVSRELARENLAEYLVFRYVHAPRTMLRDVSLLPAGHHLVFDGQTSLEPWFRLKYAPPYSALPDDAATLPELERRLNRAVAARASGRQRVGVFLSGGLDSSAITLFASRLGPVHTFTVAVADEDGDETPYAGRVASILRTHHEVLRVDQGMFRAGLEEAMSRTDQPLTDPGAVPQLLLARAARPHVDVLLSGDGGDEIFGGRTVADVAGAFRLSGLVSRLPGPARGVAATLLGGSRPELRERGIPFGLARRIGGAHVFDQEDRRALLRDPGWVRPGIRRMTLEPFYREVTSDPLNEIMHVQLRARMAQDSLARAGLATGLAGLALREPLLDRDLVSWLARLPGHWKVRRNPTGRVVSKWPLRELLRPVLGRPLVNRPKRVLPGPWKLWLATDGSELFREKLSLLKEDRLRLFLPGSVDALAANLDAPGVDARLWTLFFLDGWARANGIG